MKSDDFRSLALFGAPHGHAAGSKLGGCATCATWNPGGVAPTDPLKSFEDPKHLLIYQSPIDPGLDVYIYIYIDISGK